MAVRKPNIIFVMADDLGYGDLGSYGQEQIRTPHLDKMAREGLRFTQCYAGSTVCAPSRSVLLTGQHTGRTRVRNNTSPEGERIPLLPEDVTVAEVLKDAGYVTGAFGKWGLGEPDSTGVPNRQGFDEWYGYLNQRHAHHFYTDHLWHNEERVELDPEKDYTHDLIFDAALDFIRTNHEQPFFAYLPVTIPHAELLLPEDSIAEYRGTFPETPFKGGGSYRAQSHPNAAFAGMVTRLDRDMGRLFDLLTELGIDENTVVFFTSDNGAHREGGRDPEVVNSSGPLRGIKRDMYDGGIRVPMIARWPDHIQAGATSDQVWAFEDVLPTFAALAGVAPPQEIDGVSMAPTLLGAGTQEQRDYYYWEISQGRDLRQAVRMGDWKAVRHSLGGEVELYDLGRDIGETNDLAAQHLEIVARMETIMREARVPSPYWPSDADELGRDD